MLKNNTNARSISMEEMKGVHISVEFCTCRLEEVCECCCAECKQPILTYQTELMLFLSGVFTATVSVIVTFLKKKNYNSSLSVDNRHLFLII